MVTEVPGPKWDRSRPRREQDGWDDHAAFVDRLAEAGVIVVAGPLGDPAYGPALVVVNADNEADVWQRLAEDPWFDTMLTIESIQPWSIWVGALAG